MILMKSKDGQAQLSDSQCKLILIVLCFFSHIVLNPFVRTVCSLPTEMASLSLAEYINGNDWTMLMSTTDYFGVGFYTLFFPIMKVVHNRYILHQMILAAVCLVECIPPYLCYKIMREHFQVKNRGFCMIAALGVSFFDVVYTTAAINEHPLKVALWLVVYLLFQMMDTDSKKKRRIDTALLALILVYMQTIHSRAILAVLVLVVTVAFFYVLYREWLVDVPVFLAVMAPGYLLAKRLVKVIVNLIWRAQATGELRNSEGTLKKVFTNFKELFSRNGIKGFFNIIFSQLFAGNVYTIGLMFIFFVLTVILLVMVWKEIKQGEISVMHKKMLLIGVYSTIAVLGTIVAHGFINLDAAKIYIDRKQGAKFYFFLRYYFFYLSPMLMCGFAFLYHYYEKIHKYLDLAIALFVVDLMYLFTYIQFTTETNPSSKLDALYFLAPFCLRKYGDLMSKTDILINAFIPLIIYACMKYVVRKKHVAVFAAVLVALMSYEYYYVALTSNVQVSKNNYEYVNGYLGTIGNHEELEGKNQKLYVVGSTFFAQTVQYELPKMIVVQYTDEIQDVTDGMLYAQKLLTYETVNHLDLHYFYMLDENEYIYSKEKTYDFMQEVNVETYDQIRKENSTK